MTNLAVISQIEYFILKFLAVFIGYYSEGPKLVEDFNEISQVMGKPSY